MKSLANLLQSRLFWLQRFLAVSSEFAKKLDAEVSESALELFEHNRDALLKIITEIDREINSCADQLSRVPTDKISFFKQEKARILKEIQAADQAVMDKLEQAKIQMTSKLKELSRGKNVLSQYRRSHVPSDRLDKTL